MGQTKRIRKKYETPTHPWQKERIIEEREHTRVYGFKNKKEIWKELAKLRNARTQAKKLIADKFSEQARKEEKQFLAKLVKYGLITKDSKLEDVLGLKVNDFFERRLQTLVYKKGLARSTNQARQFIVHGHILVNNKKITAPSYMVSLAEESQISFDQSSSLSKEDHPERNIIKESDKKILEEVKKTKKKEDKEVKSEVEKVSEEEVLAEVASE